MNGNKNDEYQEYGNKYVDGVICQKKWEQEPVKVLFLLKEVDSETPFNLCKFLEDGAPGKIGWRTWNNVARWTQALLDGGTYQRKVSIEFRQKYLARIAAINLKNTPGGAAADTQLVREVAIANADSIRKHICECTPDIIVCCGRGKGKNAYVLGELFGLHEIPWEKDMIGHSWYYYLHLNNNPSSTAVPVISFCHPQMRGGHQKFQDCFEDMIDIRKHFLE